MHSGGCSCTWPSEEGVFFCNAFIKMLCHFSARNVNIKGQVLCSPSRSPSVFLCLRLLLYRFCYSCRGAATLGLCDRFRLFAHKARIDSDSDDAKRRRLVSAILTCAPSIPPAGKRVASRTKSENTPKEREQTAIGQTHRKAKQTLKSKHTVRRARVIRGQDSKLDSWKRRKKQKKV